MTSLMKTMIAVVISGFSLVASAQPQTDDCGRNMTQVRDIIRSKFLGVFDANYDQQLVGTWKDTFTFEILQEMDFKIRGEPYMICPQADKTFYLYKISDPKDGNGFARLTEKGIEIFKGTGLLWWAGGTYQRTSSLEIARRQR